MAFARTILMLGLVAVVLVPSAARAIDPVYANAEGLAIRGIDPVAYFTDGHPVEGSSAYTFEWMGATWRFTSAEHRALFEADPTKYAPQYGGYCAYAVSQGQTASSDPEAWTIVEGKLYLNYSRGVKRVWLGKRDAYIRQADARWPKLRSE